MILAAGAWRRPDGIDTACALVALASLMLALGFGYAWWAHLLVVLAIPLSFGPTYLSAWKDYWQEYSAALILWTFSDLLALGFILTRLESSGELLYPAVEMVCHAAVCAVVLVARMATLRTKTTAGASGSEKIGSNYLGEAMFATRVFRPSDFILQIKRDLIPSYEMHDRYFGASDRYMQADINLFVGPFGGTDDLVNHSCAPNAGIRFTPHGMLLIALKTIAPGEEVC